MDTKKRRVHSVSVSIRLAPRLFSVTITKPSSPLYCPPVLPPHLSLLVFRPVLRDVIADRVLPRPSPSRGIDRHSRGHSWRVGKRSEAEKEASVNENQQQSKPGAEDGGGIHSSYGGAVRETIKKKKKVVGIDWLMRREVRGAYQMWSKLASFDYVQGHMCLLVKYCAFCVFTAWLSFNPRVCLRVCACSPWVRSPGPLHRGSVIVSIRCH